MGLIFVVCGGSRTLAQSQVLQKFLSFYLDFSPGFIVASQLNHL